MFLKKLFTFKDLKNNIAKKVIFVILGFIIIVIGYILLLNISNQYLRQIISGLTGIGAGFLFLVVLFHSFFEPIYLFKNKIIRIIFPLLFNWNSFIIFIIFKETELIAIFSLFLAFVGYMFSGISLGFINKKPVFYSNLILNWLFSRFFLVILLFINIFNLLNFIHIFVE